MLFATTYWRFRVRQIKYLQFSCAVACSTTLIPQVGNTALSPPRAVGSSREALMQSGWPIGWPKLGD